MPKLDRQSQAFAGLDTSGVFRSDLPSGALTRSAQLVPYLEGVSSDLWARRQMQNYTKAAAFALQRLAVFEGIELPRLDKFRQLFTEIGELALGGANVDWQRVAQGAVTAALGTLDDLLVSTTSAIPIVGWVVDIGVALWNIGTQLVQAFNFQQSKGKSLPQEALLYDRGMDSDVTDSMLSGLVSKDWTDYFLAPVGRIERLVEQEVAFTIHGLPDGATVSIEGEPTNGRGIIPGTSRIAGAFYQARRLAAPTDAYGNPLPDYETVRVAQFNLFSEELGDLLPSAAQLGLTMWGSVLKNSKAMFKLNPDRIVRQWENYFTGVFASAASPVLIRDAWLRSATQWLCVWAYEPSVGQPLSLLEGLQVDEVPSRYRSNPYTLDQVVTWRMREVWEPRLDSALRTIMCAYVDESFATIRWAKQSRPEIYRRWENSRRLLLSHDAVRFVEPELVPDDEYRAQVVQAKSIR
ncbi:MAG: hypothetical protein K0U78_16265, partial [Actinomycetia bacterium]|nr:hypothetical protein [Actinomycetes bacterium]